MNVFAGDLIRDLGAEIPVQTFGIRKSLILTGIKMFPANYGTESMPLREDILYICEYRQLKRVDPMAELPPLLCVIETAVSADTKLFQNRQIIAVYGSTVVEVLSLLTEAVYESAAKASALTELTGRLMKCNSISELLTAGYGLLHNPLILTDNAQRIIEGTPEDQVASPGYRHILNSEALPVGHPNQAASVLELNHASDQFYDAGDPDEDLPAVVCSTLKVGNQIVGYLHIFEYNDSFSEEDRQIIQLLSNLLSYELYRHPEVKRPTHEQQAVQFFRDILDNVAGGPEEIMARQLELNIRLGQFLYVMSVFPKTTEFSAHINFHELSQSITWMFPGCFSFLFKDGICVILNAKEEILDMDTYLSPLLPLLEQHKLMVGVSNPFSVIHQLRAYGFQARKAIHLGSVIHREKHIYKFSDYLITYVSELALKNDPVETFCPPELIRLILRDQETDAQLLETLKTYLRCGRSKTITAREMFLHVNTVKYRISQIQTITGLDISNDETAFHLMLAFKMLEYKDSFQGYEPMKY